MTKQPKVSQKAKTNPPRAKKNKEFVDTYKSLKHEQVTLTPTEKKLAKLIRAALKDD